jgi:ABC-type branched-subunit amino acid transport system substrate-binding protein
MASRSICCTAARRLFASVCCLTCFTACEAVLGLDDFTLLQQTDGGLVSGLSCTTHRDCAADADARCVRSLGRCATPRSAECSVVAGPDREDGAIWIGMLAPTSGVRARTNLARRASAVLAIDTINEQGGVPASASPGDRHRLVLVACDTSRDLLRPAEHLASDLAIKAIVGPDEGQDGVLLATKVAIPNDTLVIGPTATETRLADLLDDDLQWSMVPNDQLRAPWIRKQLDTLEASLHAERGRSELKLAIAVADDAQGQSARALLSSLTFDGKPLSDPLNLGVRVRIDAYQPAASDATALVDAYLEFAPDIVLVFGGAEAVTLVVRPLEERWAAKRPREPAPEYLLTDAAKVPELLDLLAKNAAMRERVRGIGATYTTAARDVHVAFRAAFERRYPRMFAAVSGLDSTFDAVYAIAFAIASAREVPQSGRAFAAGLASLSKGTQPVELVSEGVGEALERAAMGGSLRVLGSLAPLGWDERGAPLAGALEVWCVSEQNGAVEFASSELRADVPDDPPELGAHGCQGPTEMPGKPATVGAPMASAPAQSIPAGRPQEPSQGSQMEPQTPPVADAGAPADQPDASMPATEPPAMSIASIPCGAGTCNPRASEFCCVSTLRGLTEDPRPEDMSCARDRSDCAVSLRCTSDTDCASGQVCCGITNATECVPDAMCAAHAGTRFECESSRDCPAGLLCCAQLAPGAATYQRISCEPECGPLNQGILLCERDDDCIGAPVELTCTPSRVIPNLKLCGLL